jgi:hypothetical protein
MSRPPGSYLAHTAFNNSIFFAGGEEGALDMATAIPKHNVSFNIPTYNY